MSRLVLGVRTLVIGVVLTAAPAPAWAQACGLHDDCDNDTYTPAQGDCDDTNRNVHPGAVEICGDQLDNDCDGLFDGGCDHTIRQGLLAGGGGCTAGDGTANPEPDVGSTAALFLPLAFVGLWRRRGASR